MKFRIVLNGSGGELDRREVNTEAEIKDAMIEMLEECASFSPGDKIEISEVE